jgi:hypothetical protein
MNNGNGIDITKLEQDIQVAETGTEIAVIDRGKLDPSDAGENAAFTVAECLQAADHLRKMGRELLANGQDLKDTCDSLANDIESRSRQIHEMMKMLRSYSTTTLDVLAQERERAAALKLPSIHQE